MKQIFVFSLLLVTMKLHGQSTWELLIPDYTNGTIAKSSFINDQEGWIIMVNQIWHTQDGGTTWDKNFFGYNIYQFEFKSENVGYAISQHDGYSFSLEAYKTSDAGVTWNVLDVPDYNYQTIYFLNDDTGFISGYNKIYKTEDGGSTWSTITFSYGTVLDFHFINDSIGFAVNDSYIIYKSTDKGITWFAEYSQIDGGHYTNIFFLDQNTGYAYGYHSNDPDVLFLDKTIDGGNNWGLQLYDADESITDIIFRNNEEGFIITTHGLYLFSTDGGTSWFLTPLAGVNGDVYAFDGFNDLFAFGSLGEMYKLPSDSFTWQSISQPYDGITDLKTHSFATPDTGWILDYTGVYKTTNGGITWISVSNIALDLIDAVTADLLFAVRGNSIYDDSCFVYSSSDGGSTWNLVFAHDFAASQLQMIDQNVGYVLSKNGSIWKTTDGGLTWTEAEIDNGLFRGMQFLNENEGWAIKGDWGDNAVYHTVDGGSNWNMIFEYTGISCILTNVYFLDSQNGWINRAFGDVDYYATNDGGVTWSGYNPIADIYEYNEQIYFADLEHGWIVNQVQLYETLDGGNNWSPVFDPPATQRRIEYVSNEAIYVSGHGTWLAKGSFCPVQSAFIYSVSEFTVQLTDLSTGVTSWAWDFGDGDTSTEQNPFHSYTGPGTYNVCLIATGDCGTDTSCQSIFVDYPVNAPSSNGHELVEWSLFPNPFSSSITIQFSLPENTDLTIELYDLHGKKIKPVIQGLYQRGTHTCSIDASQVPAGFYIIKATASGQSDFFKVIKL